MCTATVMLSPMDSSPQIISYRSSRLNTCPGWHMRNSSNSYSLFFSVISTPFFVTRRQAVSALKMSAVNVAVSSAGGFKCRYCARCALIRATSTLGEKGFSM